MLFLLHNKSIIFGSTQHGGMQSPVPHASGLHIEISATLKRKKTQRKIEALLACPPLLGEVEGTSRKTRAIYFFPKGRLGHAPA